MVDVSGAQSLTPWGEYRMISLKRRALYGHDRQSEGLRNYVAAVVKGAAAAYNAAIAANARVSEFWPVAKALAVHQDHTISTLLLKRGYDGLIFVGPDGAIAGHVFFQRRQNTFHMFNVYVNGSLRGRGLCRIFLGEFIKYARQNKDITHVRIGAGGHPGVVAVSNKFAECAKSLNLAPEPRDIFGGEHYFRILR